MPHRSGAPPGSPGRICGVCHSAPVRCRGRCNACRMYLWRHGHDRFTEDVAAIQARQRGGVLV